MLREGTYSVWFATPAGQGVGIVHFGAGQVSGGDGALSYVGTYKTRGDSFTAVIKTSRHTPGQVSPFSVDDLTLRLEGKCNGIHPRCIGRADEIPNMLFNATFIRSQAEESKPLREAPPQRVAADKVSSLRSR